MKITSWMSCLAFPAAVLLLWGCGKNPVAAPVTPTSAAGAQGTTPTTVEKQSQPPTSATKDAPDTQAFIVFRSTAGKYSVNAPEGWSRAESGTDVTFTDHFQGERVGLFASPAAPTIESVQREYVPTIRANASEVMIEGVRHTILSDGRAVITIAYSSSSDPDPVTGKQMRLTDAATLYYRQGKVAVLTLWAPLSGADIMDEWKRITESFRWL